MTTSLVVVIAVLAVLAVLGLLGTVALFVAVTVLCFQLPGTLAELGDQPIRVQVVRERGGRTPPRDDQEDN